MHRWRAFLSLAVVVFCSASNGIWYPETAAELRREAHDVFFPGATASKGGKSASYDDSLVLAPLYVDYVKQTPSHFAADVAELKQRIGSSSHVLLGFAAYINAKYPSVPLDLPIGEADMAATLAD